MAAAPQYLAAALELLDEFGVAEPGFGLTMKSAAIAAGVTRSTVYRYWETLSGLNDDLARFVVADLAGWQRRVLADDPAMDLGVAIEAAMSASGIEPGAGRRMLLAGWPADRPGRAFAQAWEAAWLEAFAAHIGRHLAATGRRVVPALVPGGTDPDLRDEPRGPSECRTLAVGIAAIVEGAHIFALYRKGPDPTDWDPSFGPDVGRVVSRFVTSVTEPGGRALEVGEPVNAPVLPCSGLAGPKADHLGRIIEHIRRHPFGSEGSPTPPRLIDMARLARRSGVSERWLYELWPSVASCNADLLVAVLDRDQDITAEHMFGMLSAGFTAHGDEDKAQVWIDGFQSATEALLEPHRIMVLGAAQGLMDPEVRARMAAFNKTPGEVGRGVILSLLGMIGEQLRPEVSAEEFNDTTFSAGLGLLRLGLLHPEFVFERAAFCGREVSVCGLIFLLVKDSMVTAAPPAGPP